MLAQRFQPLLLCQSTKWVSSIKSKMCKCDRSQSIKVHQFKETVKLIKSDSKNFYIVTKNLFQISVLLSTTIWTAQLFSKLIIIRNVSWAANHHYIRMISEGSCDTEDWSIDAEKSALHHRNKLHFLSILK